MPSEEQKTARKRKNSLNTTSRIVGSRRRGEVWKLHSPDLAPANGFQLLSSSVRVRVANRIEASNSDTEACSLTELG